MEESEIRALRRVRAQAELVRKLGEQLKREAPGALPCLRLDGMPHGHGNAGGLDARLIRRDAMQRVLARESALLRRYEKAARSVMDRMRPEQYAFCALYYIEGLSIADAAKAIDRSERQCMRYKREIESADKSA